MWTKSLGELLKLLIAVSVIFTVVSVGMFFLQLSSGTKKVTAQTITTLKSVQSDVTDLKVMTNATLYQIGDVSHETADMVRMEKSYVSQESKQLVRANEQLNRTLSQLQIVLQHIDQNTQASLAPLPELLDQTRDTLLAAQHATEESQKTIAKVGETVDKIKPVVDNLNGTTAHIDSISASLDRVVQSATQPKPWYKQVIGYVWAPIKLAATFMN